MFGTLRYNSTNDSTEFMDRGYGFLLDNQHAQPGQHAACDQCRSKKLRCSGQKRGCDRCKAASTTCIYSITRDDGRAKRRRRTDNPNTVKHQHEDRTCQTSTPHDPKSTSIFSNEASGGEPKSTDNDVLLAQSQQDLPRSMDNFPGTDAQVTNTTVPPQQDGLLQELEDDFDLLDSSVFDVSPEYNLQPAKSFGEFSGSVPGPELYHNLDFIPKPIYGGISILSDPRVLTAPSRQTSDDHLASAMSGDGNDDVMWSPTPSIESSNTGKALHQTIDRQLCQKSSTNVPSCDCLVVKVSLLEELGSYKVDVALNEGLATHKCCLVKSASVLDCKVCMSKSESVMLLVLVYERLVSFCEMVTDSCLKHRTHSRSRASSPNLDRPPLMIGNYMVDKDEEWDSLLGALTLTQVKMLGRQLLALRRPASTVLQGSQILKLSACERKMRALIELLKVNR